MDKTCTDEVLSEDVQEFPVIYDKSKSGHKDRLIISNAWKEEGGSIHCAIFSRKKYLASKISLIVFSGKAAFVVLLSIQLFLHILRCELKSQLANHYST